MVKPTVAPKLAIRLAERSDAPRSLLAVFHPWLHFARRVSSLALLSS